MHSCHPHRPHHPPRPAPPQGYLVQKIIACERRSIPCLFDMSSAVRLFLRQSVIRRRLPFEVVSENPDPFWSEANQRILRESIESYERGEAKRHELIED